jgi:hypothetical protein
VPAVSFPIWTYELYVLPHRNKSALSLEQLKFEKVRCNTRYVEELQSHFADMGEELKLLYQDFSNI